MKHFIVRRLMLVIPTLFGVSILVFLMVRLVPGDPVDFILGHSTHCVVQDRERLRHELGLDLPLPAQYFHFLGKVFRGNLGSAVMFNKPVSELIMREFPYTARLVAVAITFVVLLGFSFGILASLRPNSWVDSLIMINAVLGVSVPSFWLGIIFILIFCIKLRWFPLMGPESLKILILPALVLALRSTAIIARMLRSSLLEVLSEDYIKTARAKGLGERVVIMKHALRNALLPVLTLLGLHLGGMLGGAVIVENVFARHGIGFLAIEAILQRDYPLTQGIVLFTAVIFLAINFIVDLVYSYIDPRIRYG